MIYFLTPVWGEAYVRLYLDVTIPAQLADHNLPVFTTEPGTKYIIYTTRFDMETIQSSPIFKVLSATVPVVFELVDLSIGVTHDRMSDCFRRGIDAANAAGAAVVFLTPDIVFADGSFATIKRLADAGHDVVFIPAIRTLKQGVAETLLNHFKIGQTVNIRPRDLMRAALDNLHPLADLSWWNEGETDLLPANLYWRVGNEGILGRCFHLHPIFVRPQRRNATFFGTVDDDFCSAACPDASKDYVITDSDEFLAIELSDPSHNFRTGFRKGSAEDAAAWAEQFANDRHRLLFDRTIRMHTGIHNSEMWKLTSEEGEIVATSIKNKFAIPDHKLLLSLSPSFVRRLIRRAQDKRLELGNRPADFVSEKGRNSIIWRMFGYLERWPIWLLGTYKIMIGIIWALRNAYLGKFASPRFYTARYLIQKLIRQDLLRSVGSLSKAVLVSDDPSRSYMRAILAEDNSGVEVTSFVESARGNAFVLHSRTERVAPMSCDLVMLEQNHNRNLEKLVDVAYKVLRQNGRLLILMECFGSKTSAWNDGLIQREPIERALQSKFHILDFRTQGGIGSALKLKYGYQMMAMLRRRPILFRLMELTIVWIPFYMVTGSILNLLALMIDWVDQKKSFGISSLTLASKVTARQQILPSAVKESAPVDRSPTTGA